MSESKVDVVATVKGNAAEEWAKIAHAADGYEKSVKDAETATKSWEAAGTKAAAASQKSWENVKKSVAVTAQGMREAATAVVAVAAVASAAIVQGAIANERQERALRALGPAYQEITRATNGTVTATEAWRVQQQLLQSGLPTTGRELALITRAARDYAVATGTETPAAIEQLSQALANGEAGGLRRFGIAVTNGATRTETFNSALQQLQRTQQGTAPASRTLAEEVSHFGSTVTEAGSSLAGFLAQAGDVQTTMRLVGDSVRDASEEFRHLVELNNGPHTTTGAVRGRIGGVRAPPRPVDRLTAEGQATGEASTALALRLAQSATERANAPASGGGHSGPSLAERQEAALQQALIRTRAETLAVENAEKARAAAWLALAAQMDEAATASKNATVARAVAEHEAIDTERRDRLSMIGLARDRRDAELSLADAEGRGDRARSERIGELSTLRGALQGMLTETNARIEAATAEHRGAEEMNALLRERIGIQQSLSQVSTELATTQRANTAATREFADTMGNTALSATSAFADGLWAAVEAGESAGDAFLAVARAQLKALALEAVPQVFKNLALAAGAAFTNPAAVPSFLAAAGLWTAVGAVSGGIAAAIPAPAKPATPAGSGDRAASANAARAPSESSGPLTIQINVSGAMFNEGVEENVVRALNGASARGLIPRRLMGN